jgi:hypothetical protein
MRSHEQEIIEDIRRVAKKLKRVSGRDTLSRSEYLGNDPKFSMYHIYDNGLTWEHYCTLAGFSSKAREPVTDDLYVQRLIDAVKSLGRFPKASERKKFGLNFSKRRWPTLDDFIKHVVANKLADFPASLARDYVPSENPTVTPIAPSISSVEPSQNGYQRIVPPIPQRTKRKKWERTGIVGFPYAPQDESGVVALFAVLCANGTLPFQILDLNSGKGIDAICHDEKNQAEIRVELKHTLSKASWNHSIESIDCVVCWENRWPAFPKPVIELKSIVGNLRTPFA